jgi:hypothetical protein
MHSLRQRFVQSSQTPLYHFPAQRESLGKERNARECTVEMFGFPLFSRFCKHPQGSALMRRRSALFYEDCEGSSIAVQEILITHRANLAIAEETGKAERPQELLDVLRIMAHLAKKTVPAPVATAEASAVNGPSANAIAKFFEQRGHVLGAGRGVAPLELDRLASARVGAHSKRAGLGIGADQIAD